MALGVSTFVKPLFMVNFGQYPKIQFRVTDLSLIVIYLFFFPCHTLHCWGSSLMGKGDIEINNVLFCRRKKYFFRENATLSTFYDIQFCCFDLFPKCDKEDQKGRMYDNDMTLLAFPLAFSSGREVGRGSKVRIVGATKALETRKIMSFSGLFSSI